MNQKLKNCDFSFLLNYISEKEEQIRKFEKNQELIRLQELHLRYKSKVSGVPRFLWMESLETFKSQTEELKRNLMKVRQFISIKNNRNILLMLGNCGTGKSHLGAGIIRECGGRMMDSDTLILMVDAGQYISATQTKFQILEDFSNEKLLVIDEIGRSMNPSKEKGYLSYIIRNRYSNELPTVLISNLSKKDFLKFMGEPIMDRLRETCISLEFTGNSYRPSKRNINL